MMLSSHGNIAAFRNRNFPNTMCFSRHRPDRCAGDTTSCTRSLRASKYFHAKSNNGWLFIMVETNVVLLFKPIKKQSRRSSSSFQQ